MKKFAVILLLLISGILGFILSLYTHKPAEENEIQSIQVFHFPALFVSQLTGDPNAGKKIYKEFCISCHAKNPVIQVKAPIVGIEKNWKNKNKKELLKETIKGKGAMPARGGCFECSDTQLQQTIDYMLKQKHPSPAA